MLSAELAVFQTRPRINTNQTEERFYEAIIVLSVSRWILHISLWLRNGRFWLPYAEPGKGTAFRLRHPRDVLANQDFYR